MADSEPISDDSSFYGDDETRLNFQERSDGARPDLYWSIHDTQPSVLAYQAVIKTEKRSKGTRLFNMYEGSKSGRQLSETIDDFLARLPPASTRIRDYGPWIYVSSPKFDPNRISVYLDKFTEAGQGRLASFQDRRSEIEDSTGQTTKSAQTRKVNETRRQLQANIFEEARKYNLKSGKWMLFPQPTDVNRVWGIVAHATVAGDLGHAAKVATDDGSGNTKARLICIYTDDFADKPDIKRVLKTLERMHLIDVDRAIYYKADAYTHLEINGGNEWGLKASLYSSKEVSKAGWENESR